MIFQPGHSVAKLLLVSQPLVVVAAMPKVPPNEARSGSSPLQSVHVSPSLIAASSSKSHGDSPWCDLNKPRGDGLFGPEGNGVHINIMTVISE